MVKLLSCSRIACGCCPKGSQDGYLPLICPRWRLFKLGENPPQPFFRGRSSWSFFHLHRMLLCLGVDSMAALCLRRSG